MHRITKSNQGACSPINAHLVGSSHCTVESVVALFLFTNKRQTTVPIPFLPSCPFNVMNVNKSPTFGGTAALRCSLRAQQLGGA